MMTQQERSNMRLLEKELIAKGVSLGNPNIETAKPLVLLREGESIESIVEFIQAIINSSIRKRKGSCI